MRDSPTLPVLLRTEISAQDDADTVTENSVLPYIQCLQQCHVGQPTTRFHRVVAPSNSGSSTAGRFRSSPDKGRLEYAKRLSMSRQVSVCSASTCSG